MLNVNEIKLLGHVGTAELKEIADNETGEVKHKVAIISVATNRSWTDKRGNEITETQWHRVILWNKLSEVIEKWVEIGSGVYINGRIEYRKYTNEGEEKWITEIIAKEIIVLDKKPKAHTPAQEQELKKELKTKTRRRAKK